MSSPYSALQSSWKQIRLVHLEPSADFSAPVVCTSQTVSLFDKPSYIALSYCWGERTDISAISFNGVAGFTLPRNLETGLRHLRSGTEVKILWADSISINQDPNLPEKNQQVALMREIYAQATSTIIWLGEEANNSDVAMDTILDLYERAVWEVGNHDLSVAQLDAILALHERPWWSRAWVIQELLLSSNPIVTCGKKSAPIEALIHLDDLRQGWHRPSGSQIDNAEHPIRQLLKPHPFSQILSHYPNDKPRVRAGVVDLDEWMAITENFHATDSRDKIYGLLGLGTEADRRALAPDYSPGNTVANVYTRAMAHLILQR